MDRTIQKNAALNVVALLAAGAAAFVTARYANSLAGQLASVYLGLGLLVAVVGWFHARLHERERLEKLELDEMARARGSASLFEGKEAELFPARRSREQFERFFVPGLTVLLFLLQGGAAWLLWTWLEPKAMPGVKQPLVGLPLFGLFFLVLFMLGKFSATLARAEENRLLRASAAYLLLGAYLCLAVTAGLAAVWGGWLKTDFYIAKVLSALLAVVAVETLITLVLEIYRPRVKGRALRPLYESRLVSLLGQPEGLVTTAAQTLDYQFGFKVSETWFYRFLERSFLGLLLLQVVVLLLSTCVVFIEAGEQAVIERFGRPLGAGVLEAGPHLKLPWPVDLVRRYQTEQVQSFVIGIEPETDAAGGHGRPHKEDSVIMWSVGHGEEQNFLVAARNTSARAPAAAPSSADRAAARRTPPVSLLVVNVAVQFQITDLRAWVYNNADPAGLLEKLAHREVVRHLVSVDMLDLMTRGRLAAAEALRTRIQAAADERTLGARIAFVGLEGIHPPVKVAPEFQKVVAANQKREAAILAARADAIRTNAQAGAQAVRLHNEALASRVRQQSASAARAAQFTNQLVAWRAAPAIYGPRLYLRTFENATRHARKYVVLATNTTDIIQYDLQDKIRTDLLEGLAAPPPAVKP